MGKRGPKPQGKIAVINAVVPKRPRPPYGMVPRSRNLFKRIVNDNPVEAFDAEAIVLLAAFCDMENQRFLATKKVEEFGAIIQNEVFVPPVLEDFGDPDKPEVVKQYTYDENPWYKVMKETTTAMGTASSKLRKRGVSTSGEPVKKEAVSARAGLMFNG